jgi:hypothetical protein
LLTEVAGGAPGAPQFLSLAPIRGCAARWRAASRFVDALVGEPDAATSSLLLGSAARLLAATALTMVPDVLVPFLHLPTALTPTPGTLRRDRRIEANCHRDTDLADITRAAPVTPRSATDIPPPPGRPSHCRRRPDHRHAHVQPSSGRGSVDDRRRGRRPFAEPTHLVHSRSRNSLSRVRKLRSEGGEDNPLSAGGS